MSNSVKKIYLGDYVDFQNGYAFKSSDYTDKGHYLIRIKNVQQGFIEINDECFINVPNEAKFEKFKLKSGDIVVSLTGNVGRIARIRDVHLPAVLNQRVASVAPKSEEVLSPEYLYYLLRTPEFLDFATGSGKGAAQQNISTSDMEKYKVSIPSIEIQLEIVEKLDGAFAEIDLLEANLKLSEDKANQLLQSLLSAEYSLEGIPVVPLEKLVDILDNQRIPINSTERLQRLGNVPYYGATGQVGTIDKAIFNETLILLGEDGVPFFDSTKHKAYEISGPAWVNNHAHVLRAKSEMVNQRYLLHFLNIFNYGGYVNGATRLKLTQGDMKRIPVPHPNMETQEKIVLKIDKAFEVIKNLTEQINQKKDLASSLRHSLLSHALIQEEAVA
jgi:restriction endonuclease S subunit